MNIGIVVYSQSGNTYHVARKLEEKLLGDGHVVELQRVTVDREASGRSSDFSFLSLPDPGGYEAVILGAPVQAFSLAPVMKAYLEQCLPFRPHVTAALFVTKHLPFYMTGGRQALAEMKRICEAKGAAVRGRGSIVIWSKLRREQHIRGCVESLSSLFLPSAG